MIHFHFTKMLQDNEKKKKRLMIKFLTFEKYYAWFMKKS